MPVLIVDASVLAPALADGGVDGMRLRARLRGEHLVAPDLLLVEVTSVFRRQAERGLLTDEQASQAVVDLLEVPITLSPTSALMRRVWELRHTATSSDACYVALAEATDGVLLTADRRLADAPGISCAVELVEPSIENAHSIHQPVSSS